MKKERGPGGRACDAGGGVDQREEGGLAPLCAVVKCRYQYISACLPVVIDTFTDRDCC